MKLLSDLMDLSKIEAGEFTLSYLNFSLNGMFAELKEIYSQELEKRKKSNVQLSYVLQDDGLMIYSDQYRIGRRIGHYI